jgi:hypothetical protein
MIILAWIIQIIITITLSSTLFIIYISNDKQYTLLIVFTMIAITISELCKIPLVTAIYYSAKKIWRTIFVLVLLTICFSELETLITLLEMANQERYNENNSRDPRETFLFIRAIIIAFIVVIISPIITLIGLRLKEK